MGLGEDLFDRPRGLYRRAFEQLERAGRLQEAAFVLADLLNAPLEAITFLEAIIFLEGHGEYELAAKLAEARNLDAGLIVRQWFLAGDAERAIQIARRTGSFAAAVAQLAKTHQAKAMALRVLWARLRAANGDYVGAVRTIWSVESARRVAAHWLEAGIAAGGPAGAELLVLKAVETTAPWDEAADAIDAIAKTPGLAGERIRTAAVAALEMNPRRTDVARAIARALVRPMMHDDAGAAGTVSAVVGRLIARSSDLLVSADRPSSALSSRLLRNVAPPLHWTLDPADRGLEPVLDLALLPDGRLLVALGEAGVALYGRDGRERHRFTEPASRLVLHAAGGRAIALAPRGQGTWRLARLDLHARTARRWCDAKLDSWCPRYDGLWFVVEGTTVTAIDPIAADFSALWRIRDVGGPVKAFRWHPEVLMFVVLLPAGFELWQFELPRLVLRRRVKVELTVDGPDWAALAVDRTGHVLLPGVQLDADGNPQRTLRSFRDAWERRRIEEPAGAGGAETFARPVHEGEMVAVPVRTQQGFEVGILTHDSLVVRAVVELPGAAEVGLRRGQDVIALGDDLGRIQVIDLRTGGRVLDVRTR